LKKDVLLSDFLCHGKRKGRKRHTQTKIRRNKKINLPKIKKKK
jgi:hypothetical protein